MSWIGETNEVGDGSAAKGNPGIAINVLCLVILQVGGGSGFMCNEQSGRNSENLELPACTIQCGEDIQQSQLTLDIG